MFISRKTYKEKRREREGGKNREKKENSFSVEGQNVKERGILYKKLARERQFFFAKKRKGERKRKGKDIPRTEGKRGPMTIHLQKGAGLFFEEKERKKKGHQEPARRKEGGGLLTGSGGSALTEKGGGTGLWLARLLTKGGQPLDFSDCNVGHEKDRVLFLLKERKEKKKREKGIMTGGKEKEERNVVPFSCPVEGWNTYLP